LPLTMDHDVGCLIQALDLDTV